MIKLFRNNYLSIKVSFCNEIAEFCNRKEICYENVRYEDFITEKIFDIFINESVPVYYGAKHISEYVPKNTFIDREDFNSDSELMSYLNKIDKNQYMEYIYNINIFLDSEEFRKFGPKYFVENIIKTLGLANND